jgi:copper homeostasis protein
MRVAVEVCIASIAEALAAERAGADGVELCTWLACGGVTPSPGSLSLLKERSTLRRRVLVRPTPGAFHYTVDERQVLVRDVLLSGVADAQAGVVTGGLTADGAVDEGLLRSVAPALAGRELTFHRAIDHASDMPAALEQCMVLGVHRVLTSGGETLATDGAAMLKRLVERAGDRMLVCAAGGINPGNVVDLVQRTGVREVHFAAQRPVAHVRNGAAMSSTNAGVNFLTEPDEAKIEGVLNALLKAGLR